MRLKPRALVACALLTLALSGCTLIDEWRRRPTPPPPPPSAARVDLELLSRLPTDAPARQAAELDQARRDAVATPTATRRLRYALLLATPGHTGADPVAAQRQLSEILSNPDTLSAEERMLATIELGQVERQLALLTTNRRLRERTAAQAQAQSQATAADTHRQLAAAQAENVKLRKALADAQAKIDAVTHIERSIDERASGGSPPR
jgi:hypothetical protein